MTSENEYGGALFVPWVDADMKGITTDAAARALAQAGLPLRKASEFFRNCAAAGLIHPYTRLRTGKKPYLYRADQLVIAAVLHRVAEAAIGDRGLRYRVSTTLNAWDRDDISETFDGPRSPAAWAVYEYLQGKRGFSFELRTLRHREKGSLDFACRLARAETNEGTNFRRDPETWEVRSAWVTSIDDILSHLTRPREVAN